MHCRGISVILSAARGPLPARPSVAWLPRLTWSRSPRPTNRPSSALNFPAFPVPAEVRLPYSMTGFGAAEGPVAGGRLRVEIRTVNHRYFNLAAKLPGRSGGARGRAARAAAAGVRPRARRGAGALDRVSGGGRRVRAWTSSGRGWSTGAAARAAVGAGPRRRGHGRAGGAAAGRAHVGRRRRRSRSPGPRSSRSSRRRRGVPGHAGARGRGAGRRAAPSARPAGAARRADRRPRARSGWCGSATGSAARWRELLDGRPVDDAAAGPGDRLPGRPARHHRGAGALPGPRRRRRARRWPQRRARRASSSASSPRSWAAR